MTEEILKRLDLLASKLGVAAEYIFATLVKAEFVGGLIGVSIGIFLSLLGIFGILNNRNKVFFVGRWDDTPTGAFFLFLSSFGLVIGGFIATVINSYSVFLPEYYALREILSLLK